MSSLRLVFILVFFSYCYKKSKITYNLTMMIKTKSNLQYKLYKELTTKGSWLTDEPISFMINEYRKVANEKVYIAATFTTIIIRNNTRNDWVELARLYNDKKALEKEYDIYIISSFVGSHSAGHSKTDLRDDLF